MSIRIKCLLPLEMTNFCSCIVVSAVYNKEADIATFTIKAVDDPRTSNKILYIRPPANTISMNELTTLWENKIGKKLERIYVPEEQVLKNIQGEIHFASLLRFDQLPFKDVCSS